MRCSRATYGVIIELYSRDDYDAFLCVEMKRDLSFSSLYFFFSSVSSFTGPDESQSSATVDDSNEADIVSVTLNRARTIKLSSLKRPGPPCC